MELTNDSIEFHGGTTVGAHDEAARGVA
jgi:hypothetical protein